MIDRLSVTTDVPISKSEKTTRKSAEEITRRYEEELNNNLKVTQMAQSSNNSILFCDYMLNWLKMIKPNIKIPILIGVFYGFRREEILGLKWDAIDFENNSITINFTVTEASYDGKHQIVAEAKTKTSSSYRTLPLIPEIKELLLEEKEKQRENKKIDLSKL